MRPKPLGARQCLLPPAILQKHSSLTPPAAEPARLEGHSDLIAALCVLPDGRLAVPKARMSASYDFKL
jgi:hypothetical protein